jgi:superfamily II DNA or RNA helicase
VRQYDLQGTAGLIAYFGNVVYQFTLKDAIGRCLVPYDYYVHTVPFTSDEFEEWAELSRKLAENSWRSDDAHSGTSQLDPYLQVLLNQRRRLVEQAELKLQVFASAIAKEDLPHLKHTLVYASDKGRDQLRNVNRILMDTLGLKVHQVTQEETSTGYLAEEILSNFATGSGLQVLTAMRVLDEGVDIPEVERAYFLASTTVERQWIQRRGRVLRKCERTSKRKAIIHDFLVIPPPTASPVANRSECVSLLRGELKRALEFCQLADNAGHPDGAMAVLTELSTRYL